jgi:protein involved in polysaccharide export with SLBB domain
VVERAGLENRCRHYVYREFESLPLRIYSLIIDEFMKTKTLLFLVIIISSQLCLSQIPSSLKEKVLEMIQSGNMTPEQIKAEIAKAGLSEQEAIQLAKENNVDLDKFLKQENALKQTVVQSDSVPPEVLSLRKQIPQKPKTIVVPSFKNRGDEAQVAPFGYEIFQCSPTAFEPVLNMPTPANYRVGAGDEIVLNIWGQTQLTYQLTIARDGYVLIPDVGKVQVEGLSMQQVREKLIQQMSQIYEGLRQGKTNATTFLDVSLGKLRTIQVFVMGEAFQPGGYILSGMSTVFTALYYAGGPNPSGSLRQLQLIRDEKNIATIDFYDFALYGKKTSDVRLQEGDIIFIPPAGKRAAVTGNILRPAIYELKPEESFSNLLKFAGGLMFDSYFKRVHIERVVPFALRTQYSKDILDVDLEFQSVETLYSSKEKIEDGDVVSIFSVNKERENLITLSGNVWKPGSYELTPGMRIKDLIIKGDGYREDTFLDRGVIIRVRQEDLKQEIFPFNLRMAMQSDETQNLILQRLDEVIVYKEEFFHPRFPVTITGAVQNPGSYKRTENMTVADLLIMAGGTLQGADLSNIEIARLDTMDERKISKILYASLPENYWAAEKQNVIQLADYDVISVRMNPHFKTSKMVIVNGEATYPGTYAIEYEGEKLGSLIKRFGGFKSTAYLEGVRFTRSPKIGGVVTQDITNYVGNMLDSLGKQIPMATRTAGDDVPINILNILDDSTSRENIELMDGDEIIVPRNPGVVYVQGQVNLPSSVPYKKGASLDYYLKQAGGVSENGDEEKTIVVLPNRQKWEPSGFFLFPDPEILSGSTIIVPFQIKEKSMTLQILREWASISLSTASVAILLWQVLK